MQLQKLLMELETPGTYSVLPNNYLCSNPINLS